MYKIEKKPSGYILTFSGTIEATEMERWHSDCKKQLNGSNPESFGVIIDMRELQPLKPDASQIMKNGQKLFKEKGMHRSAVILSSAKICGQFMFIATQSGIYTNERYIDASIVPNPIEIAINWVKDGIDPDKKY